MIHIAYSVGFWESQDFTLDESFPDNSVLIGWPFYFILCQQDVSTQGDTFLPMHSPYSRFLYVTIIKLEHSRLFLDILLWVANSIAASLVLGYFLRSCSFNASLRFFFAISFCTTTLITLHYSWLLESVSISEFELGIERVFWSWLEFLVWGALLSWSILFAYLDKIIQYWFRSSDNSVSVR
jgi:hypothetical protein